MSDKFPVRETEITAPVDSPRSYPWSVKLKAVEHFMNNGNLRLTAEVMNINFYTLNDWKRSDWWPRLVEEIRASRRNIKSNKISDLIDVSLEAMADRLENGEYVLNNKTGQVIRKPCSLRDINAMTNNLLARQMQLEELTDRMENTSSNVQDTLKTLATEFAKMANKMAAKQQVVDVVERVDE